MTMPMARSILIFFSLFPVFCGRVSEMKTLREKLQLIVKRCGSSSRLSSSGFHYSSIIPRSALQSLLLQSQHGMGTRTHNKYNSTSSQCVRLYVWNVNYAGLASNLVMAAKALRCAVLTNRIFVEPDGDAFFANPMHCPTRSYFHCYFQRPSSCSAPTHDIVYGNPKSGYINCEHRHYHHPTKIGMAIQKWSEPRVLRHLLRYMMRPNTRLLEYINNTRAHLNMNTNQPYITTHMRLGTRFVNSADYRRQNRMFAFPSVRDYAASTIAATSVLRVSAIYVTTDDYTFLPAFTKIVMKHNKGIHMFHIPESQFGTQQIKRGQTIESFLHNNMYKSTQRMNSSSHQKDNNHNITDIDLGLVTLTDIFLAAQGVFLIGTRSAYSGMIAYLMRSNEDTLCMLKLGSK
jgi:hypothetical protein